MSGTIFNLDSANLFVGDDNPDLSQFLTLKDVTLPSLEETTKDHSPAGGVASISMGMRKLNPLMLGFNLEGINPDVLSYFMTNRRVPYTIRGNMADILTQEDIPVTAVVMGRMTKATMSQFTKDNGVNTEYEIKEIVSYTLHLGLTEKYYFDLFAGPSGVRVDGVPIFRSVARNLGLA